MSPPGCCNHAPTSPPLACRREVRLAICAAWRSAWRAASSAALRAAAAASAAACCCAASSARSAATASRSLAQSACRRGGRNISLLVVHGGGATPNAVLVGTRRARRRFSSETGVSAMVFNCDGQQLGCTCTNVPPSSGRAFQRRRPTPARATPGQRRSESSMRRAPSKTVTMPTRTSGHGSEASIAIARLPSTPARGPRLP